MNLLAVFLFVHAASALQAETGEAAWLRYASLNPAAQRRYAELPQAIETLSAGPVIATAQAELQRGLNSMLSRTIAVRSSQKLTRCFLLGTFNSLAARWPELHRLRRSQPDGYLLQITVVRRQRVMIVAGESERGVLYGVFALLRKVAQCEELQHVSELSAPNSAVRWTNEWDNLDGSIERGYAGQSIFFEDGHVRSDLSRASAYARLLASVGINGCTINNVNADVRVLTPEFLEQLARIASAFRPWGIRISISVDFASPKSLGDLKTFDPMDARVAAWWKAKINEVYRAVPDVAGILIKADSEGRLGPSTYGRTHADAANVVARALKPHGGVLVYRGFVYNHHMDWRDLRNDRARAAYDNFAPLDGAFDDNVLIQIKQGPIDFQVREPVSPLFGALHQTNETIEFQVTQEYTGQARHLCFLLPMWKQVLDFDLRSDNQPSRVKDIISGNRLGRSLGGMVAVSNVGRDPAWLGNDLAMANLYAFGRIAWDPDLSSQQVIDEWTRQTFGNDERAISVITDLQLRSWQVYEAYTGPLGAGGLTDIISVHYGPGIESSERNGWGQWHRADARGIGMDRTAASGTGFVSQYPPEVAARYESLATTPDNLLLFFHHVSYRYLLHSDKSVIQHIYDSHYEGAAEAESFAREWQPLKGMIDNQRYHNVLRMLEYQGGHAQVWRDAVCDWFFKTSGIPDVKGRVGVHPNRLEAEKMRLVGYTPVDVEPWETASGGKAVVCPAKAECTAEAVLDINPGQYRIGIEYFAPNLGFARFQVFRNSQAVAVWSGDEWRLPSRKLDGHTSVRFLIHNLPLQRGDSLRIEGRGQGGNPAALDYLEWQPERSQPSERSALSGDILGF